MKTSKLKQKIILLQENNNFTINKTVVIPKFIPIINARASVKINGIKSYEVTVRNLLPDKNIPAIEFDNKILQVISQKEIVKGQYKKYTVLE
jgi:hypothetical protein